MLSTIFQSRFIIIVDTKHTGSNAIAMPLSRVDRILFLHNGQVSVQFLDLEGIYRLNPPMALLTSLPQKSTLQVPIYLPPACKRLRAGPLCIPTIIIFLSVSLYLCNLLVMYGCNKVLHPSSFSYSKTSYTYSIMGKQRRIKWQDSQVRK